MKKCCILLTFLLLRAGSILFAQNPYIQQYTSQDGLPSNTVYYVFQDSKQFIWFATDGGVSRYDGTTFTNYRKKDGLANNEVIRIKEDTFGRIWFFHFNGSLSYIFRNKIYSEINRNFLKSLEGKEYYIDFFQGNDSTIYFYNRFFEIIALDKQNKRQRYDLHDKMLRAISESQAEPTILYLRRISKSTSDELIFWTGHWLLRQKTILDQPTLISNIAGIYTVFPVGHNTFLIDSYTNKLYEFRGEQLIDSITLPLYTKNFLKSILSEEDKLLWVADYYKGVYCLRRDTVVHRFDIQKPQSILRDHENNTWIGSMNDGVFKINPYLLNHIHYPDTLFRHDGIIGMSSDGSGGVWITSGSRVRLLKSNVFYDLHWGNDSDYIDLVSQVTNGSLLIGERGAAFYALEGLRPDRIKKLMKYRSSTKIIPGLKSIAIKRNGVEISAYSVATLILSDQYKLFRENTVFDLKQRIYSIFYDLNDNLVLNGRKMFFYRENRLVPHKALARFDNKIITNHLNIGKTTELFNIEGDSIYLINGNIFYNLSEAFGTSIDLQIRNVAYHEPALYLSTSRNVYRCDDPLAVIKRRKVHLQLIDINFRNIHDILINHDSLYIASDDGLTVIPEALIGPMTTHIPIPYLRSVFVNDKEKDPEDIGMRIRGTTKIAFSFGCINYSLTPVVYAYKLEGLDNTWTTVTSGNVIYQRLLSGNYTFKLKVRKATSDWSEIIEFPFKIKASFWRHPLFLIFLAIILLAGITLIINRRKNIQMRHRDLDHHLVTLELKALQSMMNPHFIFNALGSIQNFLLQNKTGEAGLYLSQFARLIRQNMNAINSSMINLDDEVDRLKNYLDLERLRMENKFDYKVEIDESLEPEDMQIPSMIIQPFVENSIWHGISALEDKGFINIRFSLNDENSLMVIIEDNGIGIGRAQAYQTKGEKHLKLGMEMTRKRLELLGRKYSVQTRVEFTEAFSGSKDPGTRVVLVVPVSYSNTEQ